MLLPLLQEERRDTATWEVCVRWGRGHRSFCCLDFESFNSSTMSLIVEGRNWGLSIINSLPFFGHAQGFQSKVVGTLLQRHVNYSDPWKLPLRGGGYLGYFSHLFI